MASNLADLAPTRNRSSTGGDRWDSAEAAGAGKGAADRRRRLAGVGGRAYCRGMTTKITPKEFHDSEGVNDWRVLWSRAFAVYRTRDFRTGLALINEIGRLAEEADHHPDIEFRWGVVEVRLITHATSSLTDRDLSLARQISAAAEALGVSADPAAVRTWEFALDALDVDKVRAFW